MNCFVPDRPTSRSRGTAPAPCRDGYFRELPGERRTHIHVRRAGSFNEQFALLSRDFLRTHARSAAAYGALKHELAQKFSTPEQRHDYVRAKAPFYWAMMQLADEWAGEVGWEPGPSDA